ncbi:MAG: aspartate/glutamate racemase family protein [Novosphingobium sp.]
MKLLGMIGGMSWESSAQYYRLINEAYRGAKGAAASAPCLLWSFDFARIEELQRAGDWDRLTEIMEDAARRLVLAGADGLIICTNTMHLMADAVEHAAGVPLLHIADPTGQAIRAAGLGKIGLLGTAFTMEQAFYRERLRMRHDLEVIVPDDADRALVHAVIYDELIAGVVSETSQDAYRGVIARMVERGAQAVILGCTEIMLLIGQEHSDVPLFDTTTLHAAAAARALTQSD